MTLHKNILVAFFALLAFLGTGHTVFAAPVTYTFNVVDHPSMIPSDLDGISYFWSPSEYQSFFGNVPFKYLIGGTGSVTYTMRVFNDDTNAELFGGEALPVGTTIRVSLR